MTAESPLRSIRSALDRSPSGNVALLERARVLVSRPTGSTPAVAAGPLGARAAGPGHDRLRLLDGFRFLAALSVVLFHLVGKAGPEWGHDVREGLPWISGAAAYGSIGVALFFIISGFVILMSADGKTLREFAVSRIVRLYPAYWFAVLATAALLAVTGFESAAGSWQQVGPTGVAVNLTMFQWAWNVPGVDGAFWTLWVELKFYLIIGALIVFGLTRRRMLVLAAAWPVVAMLAGQMGLPGVQAFLEPEWAPFFGAGIVMYLVKREGWKLSYVIVLVFDVIFAIKGSQTAMVPGMNAAAGYELHGTVILGAVLASFALVALAGLTRVGRVDWKWLSTAGALTYPLYLTHETWGLWLISVLHGAMPDGVVLGLVLVILLATAWLVHRFVERPLGGALRRWAKRSGASRRGVDSASPRRDSVI